MSHLHPCSTIVPGVRSQLRAHPHSAAAPAARFFMVLLTGLSGAALEAREFQVTDQHGKPVPGAVIELLSEAPVDENAEQVQGSAPANFTLATTLAPMRYENGGLQPSFLLLKQGQALTFTAAEDCSTLESVPGSLAPREESEVGNDTKASADKQADQNRPQQLRFAEAGVYHLRCTKAPAASATVYAAESQWTSQSDSEGRVRFSTVPEGTRFRIWHPAMQGAKGRVEERALEMIERAGEDVQNAALPVTIRLVEAPPE